MAALAERAVADARAQPVDMSGPLCGVQDWYIIDSTTVRVRDALCEECPGTEAYAALKVHTVLSVGCGAPGRDHFSPARPHDRRHLAIDESWRGYGLLAASGMPVLNASRPVKPIMCTLSSASKITGSQRSTISLGDR
jgi:hypothetical protein